MENETPPQVSNEVVLVAIVNKDTMVDKLQEQALMTLLTGFLTVVVTQGVPVLAKKLNALRKLQKQKALAAQKTKELTENKTE